MYLYAFNCTSPSVERIPGRLRNWFDVFPVYLSAFLNTKLYTLSLYDLKLPHAWFKTYVNDSWLTIEFLDCIFFPLHTMALLLKKRLTLRFFSKFGYLSYGRLFSLIRVLHTYTLAALRGMDSDCVDFWKSKSIFRFPLAFYRQDLCI